MRLRSLPEQTQAICRAVNAPPRLLAHLTLVHDVACQLVVEVKRIWPDVAFNETSVLYGASWHDIGKALHPEELAGEGQAHEISGEQLLIELGVAPHIARFARTHAAWQTDPSVTLEDLLVALADKCWKGARVGALEDLIISRFALVTQQEPWEIYSAWDNLLARIAAEADQRLAWQSQFPVI